MGAGARFDAARLGFSQAGQDRPATRNDVPRQGGGHFEKRALQQIGHDQIRFQPPQPRLGEAFGPNRADQGTGAITPCVVRGDCHRHRVVVAGDHAALERIGGGDRQNAGAGADIGDRTRAVPLEQIVERGRQPRVLG